ARTRAFVALHDNCEPSLKPRSAFPKRPSSTLVILTRIGPSRTSSTFRKVLPANFRISILTLLVPARLAFSSRYAPLDRDENVICKFILEPDRQHLHPCQFPAGPRSSPALRPA